MGKKSKKQKKDQVVRTPVPAALANGASLREDGTNKQNGSTRQIKWICDMLDGKVLEASSVFAAAVADLTPEQKKHFIEDLKSRLPEMSYDGINKMIVALKGLPAKSPRGGAERVPEPMGAKPDVTARVEYKDVITDQGKRRSGYLKLPDGTKVLAGSYGIKTKNDERFVNSVSFFKLWIGDRGGWNLKLYVSDDTHRVQLSPATQEDILRKIAKNPMKAASRFGHEFKKCGICGRGLTNDESRERGIGPVCAERL
jgi:Family of unknown function (DUF6011)